MLIITTTTIIIDTSPWRNSLLWLLLKKMYFYKCGKLGDTEEEKNFIYPKLYFSLDKCEGWLRNVRTEWQDLKGVITSTANYPTVGQKEKHGSNKKESIKNAIIKDMELPTDKLASQQWDANMFSPCSLWALQSNRFCIIMFNQTTVLLQPWLYLEMSSYYRAARPSGWRLCLFSSFSAPTHWYRKLNVWQ